MVFKCSTCGKLAKCTITLAGQGLPVLGRASSIHLQLLPLFPRAVQAFCSKHFPEASPAGSVVFTTKQVMCPTLGCYMTSPSFEVVADGEIVKYCRACHDAAKREHKEAGTAFASRSTQRMCGRMDRPGHEGEPCPTQPHCGIQIADQTVSATCVWTYVSCDDSHSRPPCLLLQTLYCKPCQTAAAKVLVATGVEHTLTSAQRKCGCMDRPGHESEPCPTQPRCGIQIGDQTLSAACVWTYVLCDDSPSRPPRR